jgi:putative endopeptidase
MHRRLALLGSLALLACEAAPPNVAPRTPPAPAPSPVASASAAPDQPPAKPRKVVKLEDVGLDPGAMDRNASACDDFYQFTCGGWIAKTPIPDDKARWSRSFSEIAQRNEGELRKILEESKGSPDAGRKKLGDFYAACMDTESTDKAALKPLRPLMEQIEKVDTPKKLAKALGGLHAARVWALFDISDDQDFKDATQIIATMDQNGLGLPDRDNYLDEDEKAKGLREKYAAHVERMMNLAGLDKKQAKSAVKEILEIETTLAKASKTRVERRDPKGLYNRVNRDGLMKLAPAFPWDEYFKALGAAELKDINVTAPKFFEAVEGLVKTLKPAQWQLYLRWHLIRSMAPQLGQKYADEAFSLEQAISGQTRQRDRWKRCVEATDRALGELLAQPFVETKFGAESKKAVEQMVFAIRDAFGKRLDQLDWMDDTTRARAHQKLKQMEYLIGYPVKWRTYDFAVDAKGHPKNTIESRIFEQRRRLAKVGKPLDRGEWQMTPPTVNAYYDPLKNHMVFPAGILQAPFYSASAGVAVNMGGMGMVVGHELTHGFDDEGSQFAGNGNLENWWSPEVGARFEKKGACVADQYSAYEALPGVKVNGKLTLGENIADLGGAKLAFAAYRALRQDAPEEIVADGFSEDQQFFLSVGQLWCNKSREEYARHAAKVDPHSPPRFRVMGALANLPEFAKAFSCEAGKTMTPANACEVW